MRLDAFMAARVRRGSMRMISFLAVLAGAMVLEAPRVAVAQTAFTFVGVTSHLWNDPTTINNVSVQLNWLPNTVPPAPPNDSTADVTIPSPFDVSVNGVFTVGSITINSGAGIDISGEGLSIQPGSFTGSGTINNQGTITVEAGGIFGNGGTTSDVTLTGGGALTMNSGIIGPNNLGYNGRFINANNTISGAGEIGSTFAGAGAIAFVNQGTVNANVPFDATANSNQGNPLTIIFDSGDGGAPANSGTLKATGGGHLLLDGGTIDNTGGTISASGANSAVIIGNPTTITGGTFTTSAGGVIEPTAVSFVTLVHITNAGQFLVAPQSTVDFSGTINNTGTITIGATPGSTSIAQGDSVAGASFTGGGVIQLIAPQSDNRLSGVVTNVNNTIEGVGLINASNFTNEAIVNANVPFNTTTTQELVIENGFTSSGTIEATNGGKIEIEFSGIINNAGGTFLAADQSLIQIDGNSTDIRGGTLTTSGSGLITVANTSITNLTNSGNLQIASGTLFTNGTINNTGTVSARNNGIDLSTNTTFTGSGSINLAGGSILYFGGVDLTNSSNTIEGNGQVGNNQSDLFNNALISANVPFISAQGNDLVVQPGAASTNTGTLQATNGGELEIFRGLLTNTGGNITAQTGSTVILDDVHVIGGNISSIGTGQIVLSNFFGTTLDGVTLSGTVSQASTFATLLANTVTNNAAFTITNSGLQVVTNTAALAGTGTLTLAASNISGSATDQVFTNSSTIHGSGDIGVGNLDVVNHGTITADDPANALFMIGQTTFSNDGTLRATSGATMHFSNGGSNTVTNSGTLQSDSAATMLFDVPLTMTGGKFAGDSLIQTRAISVTGNAAKTGAGALYLTSGGALSISPGKTLDLQAGTIIITGGGYNPATIAGYLHTGFNNGAWNGPGISSTIAAADPNHLLAVGLGDNAILHLSTVAGQSVDPNSSLFMEITTYGDTNLDGLVNTTDFQNFLDGFATGGNSWSDGDFSYDGHIDLGNDFNLFLRGFLSQGGVLGDLAPIVAGDADLSASQKAVLMSLVPEPSFAGWLTVAAMMQVRRRRSRNAR